ncbi:MAG: hypothetical protein JO007_13075, partial [Alphaproteobacteria bacterium]|nr:hypothetical protein [Alphaproteobacteria bacterium]
MQLTKCDPAVSRLPAESLWDCWSNRFDHAAMTHGLGKILVAFAVLAVLNLFTTRTDAARYGGTTPPQAAVNRGVVELETGRGSGISVAIAEDLA